MALPYHIRHPSTVLIIGSGGGTDVLLGLRQGVSNITALEANQQSCRPSVRPFPRVFRGSVWETGRDLKVQEAREFIYSSNKAFDLISLSLQDSFGSSAGGLHSASESYLYTTEAFHLYLSRLSDSGILAVSRWLKLPPGIR